MLFPAPDYLLREEREYVSLQDTLLKELGGCLEDRVAGEGLGVSSFPPSPPTPAQTRALTPELAPELAARIATFADMNAARQDPDMPQIESFYVSLFNNEVPDVVRNRSKKETYDILNTAGPDYFLEEIARGSIPVELAFRYELPLVYFMRWLEEYADPEDYAYAMGLCADTLAAKSRVALETTPANATSAGMIREYARRSLELAERISPDGWSGAKKPRSDAETKVPMQIAIIMAPGSAPIPGTELLVRTSL